MTEQHSIENLNTESPDLVDVTVVGGGAAGLSAALTLARARRRVVVIDAGEPRNAPAEGVHAFLGHDGIPPAELLGRGRAEVIGYGGVLLEGRAVTARRDERGFTVALADGRQITSRRLLLATGLVDHLPDIPGVAERWGRDVIHCPYCHGWEVRDRAIGVLGTSPMSLHQAFLVRQWSADVTLFAGSVPLEDDERERLAARGIAVVEGDVTGLEITEDAISGVRTADGTLTPREVVMVATTMVARADLAEGLGLALTEHPMGAYLDADATGRSAVDGVWVAGNARNLAGQVVAAAAEGTFAAAQLNADLVLEDTERALEARRAATNAAAGTQAG